MLKWVRVRGKNRPSLEYLASLPTIDSQDSVEGWELKMNSPQYRMRFFLGGYFDGGKFYEAATVDFLGRENEWIHGEQYDRRDYGT